MNEKSIGKTIHDGWYLNVNETIHGFHLQEPEEWDTPIAHIVSEDLLHWRRLRDVLHPDSEQDYPLDCRSRYTGSAVMKPAEQPGAPDQCLLFYTMRDNVKTHQRIGLAISTDMENFTLYEGNPVIVPDPALMINPDNIGQYDWNLADCRDIVIEKDPKTGKYYGYWAGAGDVGRRHPVGVIGVAESDDLLTWKNQSVAFIPRQNGLVEVPDVFEMDGLWYMTALSGTAYAGRSSSDEDFVIGCTTYAVADNPRGPFRETPPNVLIGGIGRCGYTCRSVMFRGKRYLLYINRTQGKNTLALPKELRAENGRLGAFYTPILEKLREQTVFDAAADTAVFDHLQNSFAWRTFGGEAAQENGQLRLCTEAHDNQVVLMNVSASHLEAEATITVDGVGGGFAIRSVSERARNDYVLSIEPERNRVILMNNMDYHIVAGRNYDFGGKKTCHVRMLLHRGTCEVYIDDLLLIQGGIHLHSSQQLGLFADRAAVTLQGMKAYALDAATYPQYND